MPLLTPTPTPYEPLAWAKLPFGERGRMACEAWALDGYGTPLAIYALHAAKLVGFAAMWLVWCGRSPGLGGLGDVATWWTSPVAFQKAIVWAMLFEGLGLGCGFGPLTGRYVPPVGGPLYFLRPGTTKLALVPRLPLLGGATRSWLDVALYAAVVVAAVRALLAPAPGLAHFAPLAILVPLLGVADKTIFLALRAEHYLTTIVCFCAGDAWLPGAKAVQIALWGWAGVSKLNHHFATVLCVMSSNSPFTRVPWLRRRLYRDHPRDLRPSRFATLLAHAGTALELSVALVMALAPAGPWLVAGLVMALVLHSFITSNVPMGVPIEWNLVAVYGAFALFWAHPEVTVLDAGPALGVVLIAALIVVPLVGNLRPARVSFLLAMRYYAGNWPYSAWLFRGDSYRKLARLTKSSGWVYDQLGRFYDRATAVGLVGKVIAFRLMHLQGRVLPALVERATDGDDTAYEYLDGELVAGLALGWNFGDGHLHHEQLLAQLQAQCDFAPGELRCVFVEAQPMLGDRMTYRIRDAATGLLASGDVSVTALRAQQPWERAEIRAT